MPTAMASVSKARYAAVSSFFFAVLILRTRAADPPLCLPACHPTCLSQHPSVTRAQPARDTPYPQGPPASPGKGSRLRSL
ncbi:hypothetical protein SKAU_G00158100 [Synaphobranchus kaupii]|uniref:Secreted protein n=1 Tax=Synaphobranchus kaupii TaxID=118154 RepID=A0A9Q1FII5_SYNKA|nr:hypothetical protein SKAU_G00158100 [Synaphobranchus kaupii]